MTCLCRTRLAGSSVCSLSTCQSGRWLGLIHPEDRPRADEAAAAALLRGGPRYDVEYRVIRPNGIEQIVHSQGDVTWDDGTASTSDLASCRTSPS